MQVGKLVEAAPKLRALLAEGKAEKAELTSTIEALEAKTKELAAQIKDFEGNREQRMKEAKAAAASAQKEAQAAQKAAQKDEALSQKAQVQLASADAELAAAHKKVEELTEAYAEGMAALEAAASEEATRRRAFESARDAHEECKRSLGEYDARVAAIDAQREQLEQQLASDQTSLADIKHRAERLVKEHKEAEGRCKHLLQQAPWIQTEREQFGVAGGRYDFSKLKQLTTHLAEKSAELERVAKTINKKVRGRRHDGRRHDEPLSTAPTERAALGDCMHGRCSRCTSRRRWSTTTCAARRIRCKRTRRRLRLPFGSSRRRRSRRSR